MPFMLEHVLVSWPLEVVEHTDEATGWKHFTVNANGTFWVLHPGVLKRTAVASVRHSIRIDTPDVEVPEVPGGIDDPPGGGPPRHDPIPDPLHNGVQVNVDPIALDLRILDPDGKVFTADQVTLADLNRFRTRRGEARQWSFAISGKSRVYKMIEALHETVTDPQGRFHLGLTETVLSQSAPPLVPPTDLTSEVQRFQFDLYRVGDFVAEVSGTTLVGTPWRGAMRLLDPGGSEMARSNDGKLRFPIPLSLLGRSRGADGASRPWTLEVTPDTGALVIGRKVVTATVLGVVRTNTGEIQSRLAKIFGPDGKFLEFKGQNVGGRAQAVLTIDDVAAAEVFDMFDVLDDLLKAADHNQTTDIKAKTPMVLFDRKEVLDIGLRIDISTLKTTSIKVSVGEARHLGAGMPAVHLAVGVEGQAKVSFKGQTLARAAVNGGRLEVEVGLRVDPDGTPDFVSWVPEKPFDIDFDRGIISTLLPVIGLAGDAIIEIIERAVNRNVGEGLQRLVNRPTLAARVLMTLLGGHMTCLPTRFDGPDILFEYVAPVEPEPKPRANYAGAIGRTVVDEGPTTVRFLPPLLDDTWAADNLKSKIDHIVVVMMENRSYDHVLGYRSLAPADPRDQADGWTPELLAAVDQRMVSSRPGPPPDRDNDGMPDELHDTNPAAHPLRFSAFPRNQVNLRTRLPKPVPHHATDVAEQLADQIDGPGGRRINDPTCFVNNFRKHSLGNNPYGQDLVSPFDVLRYYEKNTVVIDEATTKPVDDLPMYGFLAEHYSYSDTYYCSHPGPTLPNRMFWLTGDVQHDRYGFPILENNGGDNFLLSRAPSIFDVLERQSVSWRVYESNPSVAMLRMFARYAGENLKIRPLDDLEKDAAKGELPSVVVVEPAMHHHPQDDDHPHADMYRGQRFIRRVYDALTANREVWERTMLIITYDEHGGFYDHVIPPIADVYIGGRPRKIDVGPLGGHVVVGMEEEPTGSSTGGGSTGGAGTGGPLGGLGGLGGRLGGRVGGLGGSLPPEVLDEVLGADPGPDSGKETVKVQYGVRVPTFVVSPWVPPGKGPSVVLDHCSILKTILARFCGDTKPFLSDRVAVSNSFESFLGEAAPRQVAAPAPDIQELSVDVRRTVSELSDIVTPPLFRKQMREGPVDYHDVSGRLARLLGR